MNRLAIITTHPIQYYAPLFSLLAEQNDTIVKVFYTLGEQVKQGIEDSGFKKKINWDVPLLEGYDYTFLKNVASEPNTKTFNGIKNPGIIKSIELFKPTHILVFGWAFRSHLKVLHHFKNKIPILFRGDSTLLDEKPGVKSIFRRIFLTWIYRHIDFALYVGQNNKDYFLKHGVKANNLIFAPHAIDNKRFGSDEPFKPQAEKLRIELGIKTNQIVFLYTGKFENKKNPLLLIRAFKKIKNPDAYLLMVGNGDLEHEITTEIGGYNNILLLPFQNQSKMPVIYRMGQVLVLPSVGPGETWGLCINEAMASGLAVIASDKVGCAIDLIKKNGAIFCADNGQELFEILNKYASLPPDDLKNKGLASKAIIQNWSYHHIVAAVNKGMNKSLTITN